jgi:muramoyltetrapeptide carboxypeptidase
VIRRPGALRAGDRIALVAPASGCAREEVERGVVELRRLGFDAVYRGAIFERTLFSAGTAATRAADFIHAWTDRSIAAIVAVRGGYGSAEVLPLLASLAATPAKLFVGYSDTTTLLTWLTCHAGVTALHGPMVDGRLAAGPASYDEASFLAFAQGSVSPVELAPRGLIVLQEGEAAGPLFGGTLTMLTALLGTPFTFDPPPGAVLFLEDVNERPYKLHRLLTQLRQAGVLARASALVFGEMRACDEPGGKLTAIDAVREAIEGFPGPVLFGFPSGHTTGPCWTLPLGVRVRVLAGPAPALIVEESPVA